MMRTLITIMGILASSVSLCLGDVQLIGVGHGGSIQFTKGLGLIHILHEAEELTCCSAHVRRGNLSIQVDFARALANLENDWALCDVDIVYIQQHVFPCLKDGDSEIILGLLRTM